MSRIFFLGDIGPSGFGSVTKDLGRALIALGEDVRFISQNASGPDLEEPFRSRTVDVTSLVHVLDQLTGQAGVTGSLDIMGDFLRGTTLARLANGEPFGEWKPDAAILLGDFTAARMLVEPHWEAFTEMKGRLFHYVPIEGVDLPPFWANLWSLITPVAMCEFGAEQIEKVMGVRPPVIFHGVDTETFHPATTRTPVVIRPEGKEPLELSSKAECKKMWAAFAGVPGMAHAKWILRTDRHMARKRYNSMIRSLAPVLYAHTDIVLWMHCRQFDEGGYFADMLSKIPGARPLTNGLADDGRPLPDTWAVFGRAYPQVVLTNQHGLPRDALVSLYNAADLYVSTGAEGFGLTVAEAVACGVPVVGLDFSSVPEVIGPAGVTVPIAHLVENQYDHYWAAIDEQKLAEQVTYLMTRPTRRERLGRKGPEHVATKFRWDVAASQFADLIHAAVAQEVAA